MTDTTPAPPAPITWAKARPMLRTLSNLTRSAGGADSVTLTFENGYVGSVADGIVMLALDGAPIYRAPADWPISAAASGRGGRKAKA